MHRTRPVAASLAVFIAGCSDSPMEQPTEREFVLSADCAGIKWWSKGACNEMRDCLKLLQVHRISVDELPNTHTDVSLSTHRTDRQDLRAATSFRLVFLAFQKKKSVLVYFCLSRVLKEYMDQLQRRQPHSDRINEKWHFRYSFVKTGKSVGLIDEKMR
jgi:hypothetical protein